MADLIDRQYAIEHYQYACGRTSCKECPLHMKATDMGDTFTDCELELFLYNLPPAQPDLDEWCTDCKEYDQEKHCCPRWNRVIRKTAEEVRQHAQPEPRWIPVEDKERLPRDGQRVLITDEDGEIEVACIVDYSDIGEDIEWWAHDYKCHPIAWMPLPKPYKRSEDA